MKGRNEKGEVVVEASIIVTLVVILITVMMYIGMILYQKTLITVMANQTASNIAQVYSNTLKDPFTGYIDPDRVYQSITYSNMKTDAYMDVMNQKANVLARYRLKSSRILVTGATEVDVDIVQKPNEILKSQVIVTIRDKYDVPLVGMFGVNSGLVEFSATGRADCVDLLEYLSGVEAIGNPEDSVDVIPNMDTCLVTFVTDKFSCGFHAAVPVLRGKSMISSTRYSHCEMPANPQYNKLEFTGWVLEDGTAFSANTQIDEDITVYGTWLCEVKFEPGKGKVNPDSISVPLGKTEKFPVPERYSYNFDGWYTEPEGKGTPYYSNQTEIMGNITLYPKWTCIHTDYDSNSGEMVKKATNCTECDKWLYKCKECKQKVVEKDGDIGECLYQARCGTQHDLSKDNHVATMHDNGAGYTKTTCGECIVCLHCGGPYERKMEQLQDGSWISSGVYCIKHNDNSGYDVTDPAYETEGYSGREIRSKIHNPPK